MEKENTLIQEIIKGDINRYSILVHRYSDQVYKLAISIVKNESDAAEITQETFIKVYQNLSNYRGEAKFSTFLYRVCYNTSLNFIKKERKHFHQEIQESIIETNEIHNGFFNLIKKEQQHYLKKALDNLKADESMVLTLFYLKELSYNEIVEITDLSLSNVKVKLHRAKNHLALEMNRLLKHEVKNLW